MYILVIVLFLVLGMYVAWRKLQDKRVNRLNWDIHNKLVSLTEDMKKSSESSNSEFDLWAELNDLILEKVSEYYNGPDDSQIDRYENSRKFLSLVEKKLKLIDAGSSHREDLLSYIQELKLTKLSN